MKVSTLMALCFVSLTVAAFQPCEGWWGSSSSSSKSSSSGSSSYSKSKRGRTVKVGETTVHVGKTGIRDRDSTGHRTGLGTLAKSAIKNPVKTYKAVKAFVKNYNEMKEKNIKGGNLEAHRKANKEATKIAGAKVAAAISAAREQFKRIRVTGLFKKNPDGSRHIFDTRTAKETKDTMDANQKGRDQAKKAEGR